MPPLQLHEIVPAVTTCIVSRLLCNRPELDNHWALRDFGARLMSQICKNFNTSTNNLQTRVTRIYSQALQNDKAYLSSLYGAITGLSELGGEVVKVFVIPRLRFISERIEPHLQGGNLSNTDKIAAGHIRNSLQKSCAPVLKTIRSSPDLIEEYKKDYGFLGASLHQAVVKARSGVTTTTPSSSTVSSPIVSISGPSNPILNPVTIKGTNMGIQRPPTMNSPSGQAAQPKFMYVTQKPGGTPQQVKMQPVSEEIESDLNEDVKLIDPCNLLQVQKPMQDDTDMDDLSHLQ